MITAQKTRITNKKISEIKLILNFVISTRFEECQQSWIVSQMINKCSLSNSVENTLCSELLTSRNYFMYFKVRFTVLFPVQYNPIYFFPMHCGVILIQKEWYLQSKCLISTEWEVTFKGNSFQNNFISVILKNDLPGSLWLK